MNANQIWGGSDYAWDPYIGNKAYKPGARRVRVFRISKERVGDNDRFSTFVDVWRVDADGEVDMTGPTERVRARDIFMHWDEYEQETVRRNREREEREAEQRRIYEERNRERLEKERAAKAEADRILQLLELKGLRVETLTVGSYSIGIPLVEVKRWLGVA